MKILHLLTSINTGGAEKFCVDICNTQAKISDNEIFLCVLDSISEGQPLVNLISSDVNKISLNKQGGYSLKMLYRIYRLLSKIKPDVIHLNGRALIYASIPILIKKIPSIYTVHTMADKEYNKFIRQYVKMLFRVFPRIFIPVAISKAVGESVKKIYGKYLDKVIVNGSSKLAISPDSDNIADYINKLKKNDNTLVFIYIGRISMEKNTLMLVESFNRLLNDGCNVVLCIIGFDNSRDMSYIEECKNNNRYPNEIQFVGRKENIADYLKCADALCLTSFYEGLGIAALEAFSMGVPVLSTPSGGPSDIIISGLNGYVSKQTTKKSYIEILQQFIKKPLKNKKTIIDIYKQNYTMEICASKYLNLYKNIQPGVLNKP